MQPEDLKRVQSVHNKAEQAGERFGSAVRSLAKVIKSKSALVSAICLGGVFVLAFGMVKGMRK